MAKTLDLTGLDFDSAKTSLKNYLKSQTIFKDYNFDGSNIAVLLDLLASNTEKYSFLLNMVASESFLDSAQTKEAIVSRAKTLNYLPRSYTSASATINISIPVIDSTVASVSLPKGTTFTARVGPETYTFSNDLNIVIPKVGNNYVSETFRIYEGIYQTENFVFDANDDVERYIIESKNIDTSSLSVKVYEDSGSTEIAYQVVTSVLDLNSDSKIVFLEAVGDQYELKFPDGVIGRKPSHQALIQVEFRTSTGTLPNGVYSFKVNGTIQGLTNITVNTVTSASGGAESEGIESIRFNAPRLYRTQERAVSESDYEVLLKRAFPEINAISAYGGEELDPPQYGKVALSIDLTDSDTLSSSKKKEYELFLKRKMPLGITPIFVDPDYLYISIISKVNYNVNLTSLTTSDMKDLVLTSLSTFNNNFLNDFKTTLRYSRLLDTIDSSHSSIVGNQTILNLKKRIINSNNNTPRSISFEQPIVKGSFYSSEFLSKGQNYKIKDIDGILALYSGLNKVKEIGSIDYATGDLSFKDLATENTSYLDLFVQPLEQDVATMKNTILSIDFSSSDIQTLQVRE